MKITRLFYLNCSDAERFCDKAQYREADLIERMKLRLHFALCQTCRKYQRTNGQLTLLIRKSGIQTCTKAEKEAFRKKMEAESSKIADKNQH